MINKTYNEGTLMRAAFEHFLLSGLSKIRTFLSMCENKNVSSSITNGVASNTFSISHNS